MADRTILTSALPYANGPIHIGHLVEYIQTDIIARFLRMHGKDAIYLCADDTHGTPIEINAKKAGVEPEKFIEKWHKEHQKSFDKYNIKFDSYYSTNSDENKHFVETVFKRLKEKDMVYEKEIEQAYDEKEERFLPDRYVKGTCPNCEAENQYGDQCESCGKTYEPTDLIDPISTLSGETPTTKKTKHFYFKLSEKEDWLRNYIENNENIQSEIKNQIMNWIENGLEDWCISRDKPYFGFEIPGSDDKYFYVWLDAPLGYISSFANYLGGDVEKAEKEWGESEIIHFIGKDIVYFHLLFWPAVLDEAGIKVPDNVFVHGFLNVNDEKMSKSRGTFITADEWAEISEPELLRFYYAANLTRKVEDINLDTKHFMEKVNNELVSNIANFVYRTLHFLNRYFDSTLGEEVDKDFYGVLSRRIDDVVDHYENYELRKAMQMILHVSSEGNKYFQDKRPWITAKTDKEDCLETLTTCANLVKNLAVLLKPVMPKYAAEIEKQLNMEDLGTDDLGFDLTGHKIGDAEIIYEKIEELDFGEEDEKSAFEKLNLKVAQVKEVKEHPNADKLYILKLDVGDEERQVIAGLKEVYEIEELEEKKVILVSNLEPAKLRGEKSEGMILAAEGMDEDEEEEVVGILFVQASKPGTQVKIGDVEPSTEQITFDDFKKVEMTTEEGRVFFGEEMLRTDKEYVKVERVHEGVIR